jgi:hypothetical protein
MGTSGATWVLRLSVSPPVCGCDMRAPPLCYFAGYDGQCAQVLCSNGDPNELRELVNCLRDQVIEGIVSCPQNIYQNIYCLPTFRRVLTVFAFPLGCAFPQPVYFSPSLLVLLRSTKPIPHFCIHACMLSSPTLDTVVHRVKTKQVLLGVVCSLTRNPSTPFAFADRTARPPRIRGVPRSVRCPNPRSCARFQGPLRYRFRSVSRLRALHFFLTLLASK